jgi:hypothetical protein
MGSGKWEVMIGSHLSFCLTDGDDAMRRNGKCHVTFNFSFDHDKDTGL